jgi:hypothetical protein
VHNSRPWRWIVGETVVDLFADHRRVGSKDRSGRAAIISCDPALDHFRTAMGARGWRTNVDRFPGPGERDHLASLTPTAQRDQGSARLRRGHRATPHRQPAVPRTGMLGGFRTFVAVQQPGMAARGFPQ